MLRWSRKARIIEWCLVATAAVVVVVVSNKVETGGGMGITTNRKGVFKCKVEEVDIVSLALGIVKEDHPQMGCWKCVFVGRRTMRLSCSACT